MTFLAEQFAFDAEQERARAEAAEEEVARLRTALEHIYRTGHDEHVEIAREALNALAAVPGTEEGEGGQ